MALSRDRGDPGPPPGGEDLIFPHHEDEIAQSEGATGQPFARVWLHSKHLRVEGEKMAKSAGNFITVRELLDEGVSPAAMRHLLLSAHYRSELNFTRAGLQASARAVSRLLDFEARLGRIPARDPNRMRTPGPEGPLRGMRRRRPARRSGRGGPRARGVQLLRPARRPERGGRPRRALRLHERGQPHPGFDLRRPGRPGSRPMPSEAARAALEEMDRCLGFSRSGGAPGAWTRTSPRWVEERIEARADARADRDWSEADRIRDELAAAGSFSRTRRRARGGKSCRRKVDNRAIGNTI
jgi:cysteinyl-tRNA synthetase